MKEPVMNSNPIYIYLSNKNRFSDAVPVISSYLLLQDARVGINREAIEEVFEQVGETLADAMMTECSCGAGTKEAGVLITLTADCSMKSMCVPCLEAAPYTAITLDEFEDL